MFSGIWCFCPIFLLDILDKYEIRSKVVAITTDGASNFKSALKRHGDDYETYEQLMAAIDENDEELFQIDLSDLRNVWCPANEFAEDDVMPINGEDDDQQSDDESNETFRIGTIPNEIVQSVVDDLEDNSVAFLPNRIDCSAHALNLVGRKDPFHALKSDELYAARYISVFKKLNAIWRISSTRLGRETFDYYLDRYKIQKPHRIR